MKVYLVTVLCTENYTNALLYGGVVAAYSSKELADEHCKSLPDWDNNIREKIGNGVQEIELMDILDTNGIKAANSNNEPPQPDPDEFELNDEHDPMNEEPCEGDYFNETQLHDDEGDYFNGDPITE